MMFEEFQDGCLVLGNLSYANGVILATSETILPEAFHQVSAQEDLWFRR